jgi:hypothetical protein
MGDALSAFAWDDPMPLFGAGLSTWMERVARSRNGNGNGNGHGNGPGNGHATRVFMPSPAPAKQPVHHP